MYQNTEGKTIYISRKKKDNYKKISIERGRNLWQFSLSKTLLSADGNDIRAFKTHKARLKNGPSFAPILSKTKMFYVPQDNV